MLAWETQTSDCPGAGTTAGDGRDPFLVTRVYLQRENRERKLLDKGCDLVDRAGAVSLANAPTISDGFVTWVRIMETGTPDFDRRLRRRSLRTRRTTSVPIRAAYGSLAADGRTIYAQVGLYTIVGAQITSP